MSVDPSVTEALERALESDPANAALRLHLAGLLVLAGDPARALEHARAVLETTPDDTAALMVARDAARALGDGRRAEAYGRLLGMPEAATAPAAPPEPGRDDADAFDAPTCP